MVTGMWKWLNSNGQAVQGIALIVSLIIVAWQSRQLGKQLRLSNIANNSTHFKDLNELMLHDERAATLARETTPGLLAALIIGTFETRYQLKKAHLVSRSMWIADKQTMRDAFGLPFVLTHWERLKPEYDRKFVKFIEKEIKPFRTPRPAVEETTKAAGVASGESDSHSTA